MEYRLCLVLKNERKGNVFFIIKDLDKSIKVLYSEHKLILSFRVAEKNEKQQEIESKSLFFVVFFIF